MSDFLKVYRNYLVLVNFYYIDVKIAKMTAETNFCGLKTTKYTSTNRSKYYLKCHLILVCKYRKKLLVSQLNDDMKYIFNTIATNSDFDIEIMESDLDHIHFLLSYNPSLSIAQIVRRLKQESTRKIWLSHSRKLRNHFWRKKQFWSDGYFIASIGEASTNTIQQYILSQG